MRSYGSVSPLFWTRGSGKRLRGHVEAQLVALYLMTSPHTTMVGIFNLSLPTLCHETGLTLEGAKKGLQRCSEEQLAFWDSEEEIVFVPALARHQLGENLKKSDHKVKGVVRALAPYKGHRFYDLFIERYADSYQLKEGASESLGRDDDPDPVPVPVRTEQPVSLGTEPAEEPGTRIRPVADPLGMPAPFKRPDVLRVHAAWKQQFGLNHHRFRGYADPEALIVATAIDVHSEAECMLVLAYAPSDAMVSGRDDPRKSKHESLGYIFGNEQTFARILRAAQDAERSKASEGPAERIARLKAREGAA